MNSEIIYCIGDSHASFFSGRNNIQPAYPELSVNTIPSFKSYRLGAILAYSLCNFGSTTKGREKILKLLLTLPKKSNILLCFGEIDCRVHLIKQAIKQNKNLEEVITECVRRYFSFILEIKKDYKIIVWGVIPSTPSEKIIDTRYPHIGSCLERNYVTKIFNEKLKEFSLESGVKFVSIFEQLLLKNGRTNGEFYIDNVHLSQKAMPIVIKQFQNDIPLMNVQMFKNIFLRKLSNDVQFKMFELKCNVQTTLYIYFNNLITVTKELKKVLKKLLWGCKRVK